MLDKSDFSVDEILFSHWSENTLFFMNIPKGMDTLFKV